REEASSELRPLHAAAEQAGGDAGNLEAPVAAGEGAEVVRKGEVGEGAVGPAADAAERDVRRPLAGNRVDELADEDADPAEVLHEAVVPLRPDRDGAAAGAVPVGGGDDGVGAGRYLRVKPPVGIGGGGDVGRHP